MRKVNRANTTVTSNNVENNKKKKPFYKHWKFWAVMLAACIICNTGEFNKGVSDGLQVSSTKSSLEQTEAKQENKKEKEVKKKKEKTEKKDADEVLKNFQENLDKTNAKLIKKEISEYLYIELNDDEIAKTKIKSVKLKNQKLRINLDISEVNIEMLDDESTAMLITAGVTEELLKHDEFDDDWKTVTVNVKDVGKITYSEDDVEINKEGGFRQFPIFEQFANGEVSFK